MSDYYDRHKILDRKPCPDGFGNIVLVEWERGEYSTHFENPELKALFFGKYTSDLEAAKDDFNRRF